MDHVSLLLPWVTLALLGAFHGLNPAMGWLFAVSLGFQEQRTGAVVKALGPIALGHLLAIAAIAIPVGLLQIVLPERAVMVLGGLILLGYAAYKVMTRFRHPRWVGMRVTSLELVSWSALMAAAHGAGLMLIPALAGLSRDEPAAAMASSMPEGHAHHMPMATEDDSGLSALAEALAAISLHTLAMLLVMGLIAIAVYRWIGVGILRRAWFNLDLVWTGTMAVAGGITLVFGLWPLVGQ
jgi:hypothetical protein